MRMRLLYKMMISFMLIIVLGGLIIAVTINYSTSRSFKVMVNESDIAYAEELSIIFSLYYQETGNWEGVESLIRLPSQMGMAGANSFRRSRSMGQNSVMTLPNHMVGRGQFRTLSVVLISPSGNVIFSSSDISGVDFSEKSGISVYGDNESLLGIIYAGSMIGSELLPIQNAFLSSVKEAVLWASVLVIAATFLIVYFLVKNITTPVIALHKASDRIAKGDLTVRVKINRQDELGDLAVGFNLMTESLEAAEKWKQQIIADSAHELRTPVSLIQGHLEMMLEGVYPLERKGIQNLYDETLHLTSLITEMQELSSAEAGYASFKMEKIFLEDLIKSVTNNFKAGMDENHIEMDINFERGVPRLMADRQKLSQVLINIISNSYNFTPPEGHIQISVWLDKSIGSVCISIEDSGPGIAPLERTKIFDRFYRIDKHRNRNTGGSGLGLAISNEIIDRHGGSIKAVDPLIGKGTRILITLPA